MGRREEKRLRRAVARERVALLLGMAKDVWEEDRERARRYAGLAFSIVKRMKVRLTKEQKVAFCRRCFAPWIVGKTVEVRVESRNKRILYKCRECGYERAFGYSRKG